MGFSKLSITPEGNKYQAIDKIMWSDIPGLCLDTNDGPMYIWRPNNWLSYIVYFIHEVVKYETVHNTLNTKFRYHINNNDNNADDKIIMIIIVQIILPPPVTMMMIKCMKNTEDIFHNSSFVIMSQINQNQ